MSDFKKPYIWLSNFIIMRRFLSILSVSVLTSSFINSQQVKSPSEFLGYDLGTQFTYHHKAVEYFRYVAEASPLAEYRSYGTTYEGRPLGVCFVSSPENLKNLEELRKNNLIKTGLLEGDFTGRQIPFIWLAYNVHGNESAGMETAMKVLHTLVSGSYPGTAEWLNNCIIVIDPCQNPDGRDLYATRYRQSQNLIINPDPNAWEHNQGWPGARTNHYLFDLNRDWLWQTQTETRQRIALYNQYMPQVHADFHEMGAESTFFFPPGANPLHEVLTSWQREFHKLMGTGNSKMFDEKFRLYFTGETYDLFAPNYGDTWPLFNGAMGITYEQGGGGVSGLAIRLSTDDTLTLKTRIEGHYLASLATITVSYENRERLVKEFNKFFEDGAKKPDFVYKSIIIKGNNEKSAVGSMLELLKQNQIRYSYVKPSARKLKGFDYLANKEGEVTPEKGDILISAYQPQSRLLRVLFEPDSKSSDSISYDLTAWSLPYVYNLKAYAVKEKLEADPGKTETEEKLNVTTPGERPYAYIAPFTGFAELKLMADLFKNDLKLRYMLKPFGINGKTYNAGTIIIARGDNKSRGDDFDRIVNEAANRNRVMLEKTRTGIADTGKDLGSGYSELKKKPVVAVVCGEGTSSTGVGELWYFFERELEYPVTLLNISAIDRTDLSKYDVIMLPSGSYAKAKDKLLEFARKGGRIVALESAIQLFADEKGTALNKAIEARTAEEKAAEKKLKSDDTTLLRKFGDERRYMISERSAGSIYRVKTDETNPYAFGLGKEWFIMKRSAGYPFLQSGYNIGYITGKDPVAGFAGFKFRDKIKNTIVAASETMGSGEIIYITDNPYFRAFWKSGRVLLGNTILR